MLNYGSKAMIRVGLVAIIVFVENAWLNLIYLFDWPFTTYSRILRVPYIKSGQHDGGTIKVNIYLHGERKLNLAVPRGNPHRSTDCRQIHSTVTS